MNDRSNLQENKRAIALRMLLYVLLVAFFVCIIFIYYAKLYSETREGIIDKGRINAIESAAQIDRRISSRTDILLLAGYTLDSMIRDGRSQEELLDYLRSETVAVGDSLIADTTGIYGFIKGEYMDGSGWVPAAGYDPTVRPWYTEAMAGGGDLVIVDPYVDLDTGTVMVAIAKSLGDGKSVVGIDMSMDDLQEIVAEHVAQGRSYAEFVVNAHGIIIAHSTQALIGTNLETGADLLSRAIAGRIRSSDDGYFYLNYGNRDYMVYIMPLECGWTCVSAIDATDDLSRLRIPLFVTILTALILVIAFLIFIHQSEEKSVRIREAAVTTERALASSEAKTSFLSNMSHEIRTPINAILGMNEMVLRESKDEDVLMYSENIRSAGTTLLGIINDILDFSKIEAGKIEILPVDYDPAAVLRDLVTMIRPRAEDKGLYLKTEFDPSLPARLHGDEMRLKQIITNILTNAVKYTEKGGVTFRVGCTRDADAPEKLLLHVAVEDTGIGIRGEDLDRLFSKFERIDEERNRHIEGTGLGMSITMSLLELMGSTLQVKSVYGEGSTFFFDLAQDIVDASAMGDPEARAQTQTRRQEGYREKFAAPDARVLVVDDNSMNLLVFKNLVKQTQIRIDTAESGDEGLRMSRENRYDIIYLDHMMPGKDGIETLHELRAQSDNPNTGVPVICLTANALSGARDAYIEAGFDDYLSKPIEPDWLEDQLLAWLPEEKIVKAGERTAETAEDVPEAFSALEGGPIDAAGGLVNNGGADAYRTVLHVFYTSVDGKIAELDQFFTANEWTEYTIKVHALKSSARIIGAAAFGEEAQRMEDAGKAGDTDYIRAHHAPLMQEARKLKEALEPLFPVPAGMTSKPEADPDMVRMAYEEIRAAAEAMDCDRLEASLSEMQDYSLPEADEARFAKMREAVEQYAYDKVLALIKVMEAEEACDE